MSRAAALPGAVDEDYDWIASTWTPERILNTYCSQWRPDEPTLSSRVLRRASSELAAYFGDKRPTVLEVFAGNGAASRILRESWQTDHWLATDAVDYFDCYEEGFEQLTAPEAVIEHGAGRDVLLMISPPPAAAGYRDTPDNESAGYADYFAIRMFLHCGKGWIVFIGALGASDGSTGLYRYLIENTWLALDHRYVLHVGSDIIGDPVEKELFVFKVLPRPSITL